MKYMINNVTLYGYTQLNMGASFKLSIRVHFPRCLPVAAHFSPLSPTSLLHPVVYICHRDSHLLVPSRYILLPAISWPSLRSSCFWLDHECFDLGSCWCHPFDVSPPPDLVLVCCLLCGLHVYSPSNFFVSDLVCSGLSCSFF